MNKNTYRSRIALFCLFMSIGSLLWRSTPVMGQTPVKSSREVRMRRIEEHRQIRQRTLELTRDLRRLHLTPEQRLEIRKVLARYNTRAATESPAAERMDADVHQILTAEQSEQLNTARQEREERAQRGPDFHVDKKP